MQVQDCLSLDFYVDWNIRAYNPGSLYIAGFAQSGDPHAGLILSIDSSKGYFAHIMIKNDAWTFQSREQNVARSMSLMSLLKIHDVSAGVITAAQLEAAACKVAVPPGSESGECLKWVLSIIQVLHAEGIITLTSVDNLTQEFSSFALENCSYAERSKFPNIGISAYST
ncbi:hypothetical protein SCP_1601040 [Sparassis crispa]|uniref:Uncharacterized protein n=1 Tax=Sparassis crispa TaxID=139825 RepID=A0A401H4V1_9APHY|nr:hypothetical protein SCP_1601040 [Sparassis crispa]GBE89442.1 hypothetical protein SCP_1601040 [Sparassis crispa]